MKHHSITLWWGHKFRLLTKVMASNVHESTDKLTSERKSPVKQQILVYITAVYKLVNGDITRQKQQIAETRSYCLAVH